MTTTTKIETTWTTCDACGREAGCAMLGPHGSYTVALCPQCHPPLLDQIKREQAERDAYFRSRTYKVTAWYRHGIEVLGRGLDFDAACRMFHTPAGSQPAGKQGDPPSHVEMDFE